MFERRLKIFLGLLIGVTVILLFRAAHLQLANGDYWRMQASQTLHRQTLVEPIRGKIVDFKDRTLAEDVACIDAAVDYRAIDLDEKWLTEQALSRLNARLGLNYRRAEKDARKKMLDDEIKHIKADIAGLPVEFTIAAPGRHIANNALGALLAVKALDGDVLNAAAAMKACAKS